MPSQWRLSQWASSSRPLFGSGGPLLTALSLDGASHHGGKAAYEQRPTLASGILRVPPLLGCAPPSILCGYQRVRLASAINLGLAVLDTATLYCAARPRLGLPALGWAIAATCGCASLVALLAVACQPPDPTVSLFGCFCDDDFGGGNNSAETPANSAQPPPTEVDAQTGSARSKASASLLSLACDSINVLIRSLLLSGSVLSLTLATAPLGTAALNAHAVILQLWMLTSYFVDGFADAGTMIGSRLLGEATASAKQRMRSLTLIVVLLGFGTGLAVSGLLGALRDTIMASSRETQTPARGFGARSGHCCASFSQSTHLSSLTMVFCTRRTRSALCVTPSPLACSGSMCRPLAWSLASITRCWPCGVQRLASILAMPHGCISHTPPAVANMESSEGAVSGTGVGARPLEPRTLSMQSGYTSWNSEMQVKARTPTAKPILWRSTELLAHQYKPDWRLRVAGAETSVIDHAESLN